MIIKILKRDGRIEFFDKKKIADAIFKAAQACGGKNRDMAAGLADLDLVEEVLINEGHAQTAKAYILYRERRQEARKISALIGETSELFTGYLADKDWGVKENANMQKSVNGLNNYVREHFTKKYWLYKVYPKEVREAH